MVELFSLYVHLGNIDNYYFLNLQLILFRKYVSSGKLADIRKNGFWLLLSSIYIKSWNGIPVCEW